MLLLPLFDYFAAFGECIYCAEVIRVCQNKTQLKLK